MSIDQNILDAVLDLQTDKGASVQDLLESVNVLVRSYQDGCCSNSLDDLDNAENLISQAIKLINKADDRERG